MLWGNASLITAPTRGRATHLPPSCPQALGSLCSLTHLDASGNKLNNVLGFRLPAGVDSNLRFADFSSNLVTSIDDLSAFSRLMSLDLSFNQVRRCG